MLPSFASQPVTILTPGSKDEWGHPVDDWGHPTVTRATAVWESSTNLLNTSIGGLEVSAGSRNVYLNPGTPVTARSRIRFPDDPGRDWEIIGEPAFNKSPTGAVSNITVLCRRWEAKR